MVYGSVRDTYRAKTEYTLRALRKNPPNLTVYCCRIAVCTFNGELSVDDAVAAEVVVVVLVMRSGQALCQVLVVTTAYSSKLTEI